MTDSGTLRIGFVGTGFVAGFHLLAFEAVRNSVIAGVYSPHRERRDAFAASSERARARSLPGVRLPRDDDPLGRDRRCLWISPTTPGYPS